MAQQKDNKGFLIAHLSQGDNIQDIKIAFEKNNSGYTIDYRSKIFEIESSHKTLVLFIQSGSGNAAVSQNVSSKFGIGDIIILQPGEILSADSSFSSLIFEVPDTPSDEIPSFIRPDWDRYITDTPGGCATETNAYRRILLTWKKDVGHYVYHALNAHRVRIMDSFSHYHPVSGGFDEFYLVQMALPEAKIITSNQVSKIENPALISKKEAVSLLVTTPLVTGDLVYLPRGVMHRGMGGVLAQVITVPGFIPGAEIGLDHHLKQINDRLGLKEKEFVSYNHEASASPIIK